MINFDKLKNSIKHKEKVKKEAFENILKSCINKIEFVGNSGNVDCWYMIPRIVLGYPKYNVLECAKHIESKLKKESFEVIFYEPSLLFISWKNMDFNLK